MRGWANSYLWVGEEKAKKKKKWRLYVLSHVIINSKGWCTRLYHGILEFNDHSTEVS